MGKDPFNEAARWWVRIGGRPLSAAEADAFQRWLARRPENAAAWAQTETAWALAGEVATAPQPMRLAARREGAARRARPGAWGFAAAAAAGVLLAMGGLAVWMAGPPRAGIAADTAYVTAVGEIRAVTLADGSTVTLDADSALTVRLAPRERDVRLVRGRAHFEVAHAAARPFRVAAADAVVTATGTSFDVNLLPRSVDVVLLRGGVIVQARGDAVRLRPGEHVAAGAGVGLRPAPVDALAASGWRQGRLSFHDAPLADIAQEMNRYGGTRLVIADPDLAGTRFSGVFRAGDGAALAEALQGAGLAGTVSRRDGAIIIGAAAGATR